jgi:5-methylcytosine-specific restriction endonuclease McrA
MTNSRWSGSTVATARKHWALRLPLPCFICGGVVDSSMRWVVEHKVPRKMGGSDHVSNQWVSHRLCSNQQGRQLQGGRNASTKTRAKAKPVLSPPSERGLRGI